MVDGRLFEWIMELYILGMKIIMACNVIRTDPASGRQLFHDGQFFEPV